MLKRLIKRLFLALFTEELEALEIDFRARLDVLHHEIAHDLMNDTSFIYDLSQKIIEEGDIKDGLEDSLRESLEALEGRIDDIERDIEDLEKEVNK